MDGVQIAAHSKHIRLLTGISSDDTKTPERIEPMPARWSRESRIDADNSKQHAFRAFPDFHESTPEHNTQHTRTAA